MVEKLIKEGSKKKPSPVYIALGEKSMEKIGELANKYNTTKREIVRYLVDLAYEGEITLE